MSKGRRKQHHATPDATHIHPVTDGTAWISLNKFCVRVRATDEGVLVDILQPNCKSPLPSEHVMITWSLAGSKKLL
jgi:hypothetical protein